MGTNEALLPLGVVNLTPQPVHPGPQLSLCDSWEGGMFWLCPFFLLTTLFCFLGILFLQPPIKIDPQSCVFFLLRLWGSPLLSS